MKEQHPVVNRDAHSPFMLLCLNTPWAGEPGACTKGKEQSPVASICLGSPSISMYF